MSLHLGRYVHLALFRCTYVFTHKLVATYAESLVRMYLLRMPGVTRVTCPLTLAWCKTLELEASL